MVFSSKVEKNISIALLIVFALAIGYIKFFQHEMWKDEWQAWFVAKDMSLIELTKFLYYEGHPALWYLYLKPYTWLSGLFDDDILLKSAHYITVIAGLYIFFIRFNMSWTIKIMAALSYFIFFEYGIISRGYFLLLALFFWVIYSLKSEKYNHKTLGIGLFLLCQTEVYGVFMVFAILVYLYLKSENRSTFWTSNITKWSFIGLAVFVISVFPRTSDHLSRVSGQKYEFFDKIWVALQGNLSNTYLLGSTWDTQAYGWTWLGLLFSVISLLGIGLLLQKNKPLLWASLTYILAAWLFSIFFLVGGVRHWGLGFVFLIGLIELRNVVPSKDKLQMVILSIFCGMSMIHGVKALKIISEIPFSNAQEAGLFIREKVPVKVPIVSLNKFETVPVSGYSGRQFYELPDGVEFSYFRWVDKIYVPTENELKLFAQFKGVSGVILVSSKPIDNQRYINAKLWKSFEQKNYKNENYYIYTLSVK